MAGTVNQVAMAAVAALLLAGCQPASSRAPARMTEDKPMATALSPAGDKHPGQIVNDDKVDGRAWTEDAAAVPATVAWVNAGGTWKPVVRIEITGTPERRRITKFGPGGEFLEATEFTAGAPR